DRLPLGRLDEKAAIGAHRQGGADRLLRLDGADGDGDDLGYLALLLETDDLLDGDLVEGVHRHLDIRKLDARPVGLDADLDVEIDHALYSDQNFHSVRGSIRGTAPQSPVSRAAPRSSLCALPFCVSFMTAGCDTSQVRNGG